MAIILDVQENWTQFQATLSNSCHFWFPPQATYCWIDWYCFACHCVIGQDHVFVYSQWIPRRQCTGCKTTSCYRKTLNRNFLKGDTPEVISFYTISLRKIWILGIKGHESKSKLETHGPISLLSSICYYRSCVPEINDIHSIVKLMKPFGHSVNIYLTTTLNLKLIKALDIVRNKA